MIQAQATRLWSKQHGAAETRLTDAIAAFFDSQLERVARDRWFSVDDEHAEFLRVVRPHVVASMGMGAQTQLALGTKAFVDDVLRNFSLPKAVLDAIEGNWNELEQQPFWRAIQVTTEVRVTAVLNETIGLGPRAAGKVIRETLGETAFPRERANAIARTETTGAMNAGTMAGMEELAADGLLSGKTWDALLDDDLRASHQQAHEQTVGVREMFKLPLPTPAGGRRRRRKDFADGFETAPFPGHWQLSAGNRVNCRCTILSAFSDADHAAVGLDPAELEG